MAVTGKMNIDKKCNFYGYLKNKEDLPKIMRKCDIRLFTSIKEDTPAIIMEAMTLGSPTVCFDLYGAKDLVNNNRGVKIIPNIHNEKNLINFKNVILRLIKTDKKRYLLPIIVSLLQNIIHGLKELHNLICITRN
jgi:glycosyltransferase involved in cell wall biosynthesis